MSASWPIIKPSEAKREEFRKYLEHAGVMDVLTNVLLSLYEEHERPEDAIEYIRKHFTPGDDKEMDTTEVESLKKKLAEATAQISELKEKLAKYETEHTHGA